MPKDSVEEFYKTPSITCLTRERLTTLEMIFRWSLEWFSRTKKMSCITVPLIGEILHNWKASIDEKKGTEEVTEMLYSIYNHRRKVLVVRRLETILDSPGTFNEADQTTLLTAMIGKLDRILPAIILFNRCTDIIPIWIYWQFYGILTPM